MHSNPEESVARTAPLTGRTLLRLLVILGSLVVLGACGSASLKYVIPPSDVSQLDDKELEALQAEDHEVEKAKMGIERARQEEEAAGAEVDRAKELIAAKEADLTAARAEASAAQANQQEGRYDDAQIAQDKARAHIRAAEAQLDWAKANLKAKKAKVEEAELNLSLQEASRELARVKALADANKPAAENYAIVDFRIQEEKIRKAYAKAARDSEHAAKLTDKAFGRWERMKKRAQ